MTVTLTSYLSLEAIGTRIWKNDAGSLGKRASQCLPCGARTMTSSREAIEKLETCDRESITEVLNVLFSIYRSIVDGNLQVDEDLEEVLWSEVEDVANDYKIFGLYRSYQFPLFALCFALGERIDRSRLMRFLSTRHGVERDILIPLIEGSINGHVVFGTHL